MEALPGRGFGGECSFESLLSAARGPVWSPRGVLSGGAAGGLMVGAAVDGVFDLAA